MGGPLITVPTALIQRYELAPAHSITSSARANSVGGTSMPRALAILWLITSSYFTLIDPTQQTTSLLDHRYSWLLKLMELGSRAKLVDQKIFDNPAVYRIQYDGNLSQRLLRPAAPTGTPGPGRTAGPSGTPLGGLMSVCVRGTINQGATSGATITPCAAELYL